jgi:SsrA-binding protein
MAKGRKRKAGAGDVATNRQAAYRYHLLERFECGLVLTGTEVKSLREGNAQLKDSYAVVRDGEVWLIGLYIAPYGPAARENHDPERPRKLLLHRSEIERLIGRTRERGLTLVPTRIYFAGPRSRAKVELALARGKDLYDKREAMKTREMARDVQRELREARHWTCPAGCAARPSWSLSYQLSWARRAECVARGGVG